MAAGLNGLNGLTAPGLVVLMEFKPEAGAARTQPLCTGVSTARAKAVPPKSAFLQKNALVFSILVQLKKQMVSILLKKGTLIVLRVKEKWCPC